MFISVHNYKIELRRTLAMALLTVVLAFSQAGPYLNSYLFYQPAMSMRAKMDWQPTLNSDIRLVLFEDRSLEKMGREPTFSEWYQVAELLFARGYDQVFLAGIHEVDDSAVGITPRDRSGTFIVGAVVAEDAKNSRAQSLTRAPRALLTPSVSLEPGGIPVAAHAIMPDARILDKSDAIGSLNILNNDEMPAAYQVDDDLVLPSMGLLAAKNLRWIDGQPVADNGAIPLSAGGILHVDFVDPRQALTQALPITAFLSDDRTTTRSLSPAAERKIAGGKIAVLVPDAFTGSRFLDTPYGKVLSYLAVVSVINSTLNGRHLYRPAEHWIIIAAAALLLAVLLSHRQSGIALASAAVCTVIWAIFCLTALYAKGWILPGAPVAFIGAGGFAIRFLQQMMTTMSEKMALNKEMEIGRTVQEMLLPKQLSGTIGRWDYQVVYRPYWAMAGDWFQIYTPDGDRETMSAVLAIGDSVGKGPGAALNTAVIASVWSDFKDRWRKEAVDIEKFIASLDRALHLTFAGEQNTTLSLVHLLEDGVQVVGCAAPAWIHIAATGNVTKKVRTRPAAPLGFNLLQETAEVQRKLTNFPMGDGDVLMAVTDGVMDGPRGFNRFSKTVEQTAFDLNRADLFEALSELAIDMGKDSVHPDDITLLIIRRRPAAAKATEAA